MSKPAHNLKTVLGGPLADLEAALDDELDELTQYERALEAIRAMSIAMANLGPNPALFAALRQLASEGQVPKLRQLLEEGNHSELGRLLEEAGYTLNREH